MWGFSSLLPFFFLYKIIFQMYFFVNNRAVKISALTHSINFFQFDILKIFNAINCSNYFFRHNLASVTLHSKK